jgi:methyl-accepting chemotaxis protein
MAAMAGTAVYVSLAQGNGVFLNSDARALQRLQCRTAWNLRPMALSNMKISARLILGFGMLTVLILLIGAMSLLKMQVVEESFRTVIAERYPNIVAVNEVEDGLNVIAASLRNALILVEPGKVRQELSRAEAAGVRIAQVLRELESRLSSATVQAAFAQVMTVRSRFEPLQAKFAKLVESGQTEAAAVLLLGELQAAQTEYFTAVDAIVVIEHDSMNRSATQANGAISGVKAVTWVSAVLAVLAAVLVGSWIIRSISDPINQAVAVSRAVSSGDLSIHI